MKIGLLDHMGYGNLGDAATQDALIANIKARVPGANIVAFSLNPDDTRRRHNIPCYSITHWHPGLHKEGKEGTVVRNPRSRLQSILKNIPVFYALVLWILNLVRELMHLGRSFRVLRTLDTLIIAGGGQLCELWRGPWSHPYNVFKFSFLTKLANRKLLFVNVGAGPVNSLLSRVFVRCSVALADYVSFRDVESQRLVKRLGVGRQTHVFADSVYALDISDYDLGSAVMARPRIGLNPIGFCDPRIWPKQDVDTYSRYLDKLAAFSLWLLNQNYSVRIFSGEESVDVYALKDLKERLQSRLSPTDATEMFAPTSESVRDLLVEMSRFDFVVTSKFHGVVFSHLLEKPCIALSYHNKIDDLMRVVGQSEYCLNIETFDEEHLKGAFRKVLGDAEVVRAKCRQTAGSYSDALKDQFDELFLPENLQSRPDELELRTERDGVILGGSSNEQECAASECAARRIGK